MLIHGHEINSANAASRRWELFPNSRVFGSCDPESLMKKNESENTEAKLPIPQQFPFQHLLPLLPINGLTPGHFRTLAKRLRRAVAAKTDGLILSEEETRSFRENCSVIRKASLGLELRNYSLLEIYEARQWRADYQSVKDFAKFFAQMSKSQLMKCVDSAIIKLSMVEAGLEEVAPKGRQVEALAKVPSENRISAWLHAIKVFEIDGTSYAVAQNALRDYCRDRELPYGRRQANGSKNIGLISSLPANQSHVTLEVIRPPQKNNAADWINLSESDERILSNILPLDIMERAQREFPGEPLGMVVLDLLGKMVLKCCDAKMSQHMLQLMGLLGEKKPAMVESLVNLALLRLIDVLEEELELRIGQKRMSKP